MNNKKLRWLTPVNQITALFFISGFAALIYQVIWQRILYATFGIDIESVTVIVSVFMFGLGIGSLAGGWLQTRFAPHSLKMFIGIECAIGLFGLVSISLIETAGLYLSQNTLPALIETTYALLFFPTMLMGTTLPLLVGYSQRYIGNLGAIVGRLYACNTLGSALAALITVTVLFRYTGEQSTIIIAALCNATTAFFAWCLHRKTGSEADGNLQQTEEISVLKKQTISYKMILLLAAILGFVSLSCEIFWFRIVGFMTGTRPQIFGILLAFFLGGIALGSLKARKVSLETTDFSGFIWPTLWKMAVLIYFSIPFMGGISVWFDISALNLMAGYLTIAFIGYYSGSIFPILCQEGNRKTAASVSLIYFFNIIGATSGALITGLVLLNIFSLGKAIMTVCAILLIPYLIHSSRKIPSFLLTVSVMTGAFFLQPVFYSHVIDQLFFGSRNSFKYVKENRSGLIGVVADPDGDVIIGNGAYDGRFNIDPVRNGNGITRAYMIPVLHPNPKRILEIGLSGGAWARILTLYQPMQELMNVEINPGYVDLIKYYPDISPVLHHPKVLLQTDDGRRWLKQHPGERFDVIVMNTIIYWRSNSTNMLSREFLTLCKEHLNPGGIIYYNSTGALDSIYTAAHVFQHVVLVNNFIAAGDHAFDMPNEQKRRNLLSFLSENNQPLFLASAATRAVLESLISEKLDDLHDSIILKGKNLYLITDDNMAPEYKHISEFEK
jgi:spermidine synthase/MFS family permease